MSRKVDRAIRREVEKRKKELTHEPQRSYSMRENTHQVPLPIESSSNGQLIRLGLVGDMHINTKLCREDGIHRYFQLAQDYHGIKHFFSAGDQIDGLFIYPEQHLHLKNLSITNQVDYAAELIDRAIQEDHMLYIINGNHELGGRKGVYQCYGIDPSKMLQDALPKKIKYLGHDGNMYARAKIHPRIALDMVHTRRYVHNQPGSTKEVLLKGHILGYTPEDRPQILTINHTHAQGYVEWQGCHAFLPGGFEDPNNYTARLGQGRRQGSYSVVLYVDNKGLQGLQPYFVETKKGI